MSSILSTIGELEKEISMVDGILQNILIYETKDNGLLVNVRFGCSNDHDTNIIGGLTATLNEFGGSIKDRAIRTIVLEQLKLIFTFHMNFIFVLAVDPTYDDSQFSNLLITLTDIHESSIKEFHTDGELIDEIVINTQLIVELISEELNGELVLGKSAKIYPFKLREEADIRTNSIISQPDLTQTSEDDIQEKVINEITAGLVSTTSEDESELELLSKNDALYHLLNKFVSTFSDALQITLIRFSESGNIHKITAGRLEPAIEDEIYNIILGMMNDIIAILDKSEEFRTMDLEDKWLYFQIVTNSSFLYITVENKDVLALIRPLIERISITIANLFPNDV